MYGWICSQFGVTVVQSVPEASNGPNVRVEHFPLVEDEIAVIGGKGKILRKKYDVFDEVIQCFNTSGYSGCRQAHGLSFRASSADSVVAPRAHAYNPEMIGPTTIGKLTASTSTRLQHTTTARYVGARTTKLTATTTTTEPHQIIVIATTSRIITGREDESHSNFPSMGVIAASCGVIICFFAGVAGGVVLLPWLRDYCARERNSYSLSGLPNVDEHGSDVDSLTPLHHLPDAESTFDAEVSQLSELDSASQPGKMLPPDAI